jgi:hypothetical protein
MVHTSAFPPNAPGILPGSCPYVQLDSNMRNCFDATLSVAVISKDAYNLNLYPNPIKSGDLTIEYQLSTDSYIQFKIIDCIGREVMVLQDEHKPPGIYTEQINIDAFARGIYLFVANINGELHTIKFIKL